MNGTVSHVETCGVVGRSIHNGSMQRFYFHVVTDVERIRDPDGSVFVDLVEAISEAKQDAIELATEELRCGRQFPASWSIQVEDADGVVVATIECAALLRQNPESRRSLGRHRAVMEQVMLNHQKTEARRRELQRGMSEAWLHISRLRSLSAKFPTR